MKTSIVLILSLVFLAITIHGQGPGRGEKDGGASTSLQNETDELFVRPEKIIRKVDLHEKGYMAETTTTDQGLVSTLQTHVRRMGRRPGNGMPAHGGNPALGEFFARYDEMEHTFTELDNGIRVEVVCTTPGAVAAAHNHARTILDFSSRGDVQTYQPQRVPPGKGAGGEQASPRVVERAKTFGSRAEEVSTGLIKALGGQLKAALVAGGPEAALPVCNTVAIPLTKSVSDRAGDLVVTRVTDRSRNPKNTADDLDRVALARFRAAKSPPGLLAHLVTEADGETLRYYRPLKVSETCLKCHGDRGKMSEKLNVLLDDLYPDDQAHGYAKGDLRGLIRVQQKVVSPPGSE